MGGDGGGVGAVAGVIAGLEGSVDTSGAAGQALVGPQSGPGGPSGAYGSSSNRRYNTLVGSKSEGRILGRYGDLSAEDLNRGDDLVFLEPNQFGRPGLYDKDAMAEFRASLVPDEEEVESTAEPSIQDDLDQIDLMNKLAGARNLRFAPGRGIESYEQQIDTLAERDQLVGARGPGLFAKQPRSVLDRYSGSQVKYQNRL